MSEYSELVKNYNKIREYLRDFYIYGFRSRDGYTEKSGRSYDNERRRIESYLSGVVSSRTESSGKKFFITADAAEFFDNPLFKTFKCKSFTKNDVTLHFAVLYVLEKHGSLSLADIDLYVAEEVTSYFDEGGAFDVATIRNKLKEYTADGIVTAEKVKGKTVYSLKKREDLSAFYDALGFYTAVFPLGVIGSFIMDREGIENNVFTNKHTYFATALDSEIICDLLSAISQKKAVRIETSKGAKKGSMGEIFIPFKVAITVQNGRNYAMGYSVSGTQYTSLRLDNVVDVTVLDDTYADYDDIKEFFMQKINNVWGVSMDLNSPSEHLLVDIRAERGEEYIVERIKREKRIGTIEKIADNIYRMEFDVIDLSEMTPWLRTFIGRIEYMECSDKRYLKRFIKDIEEMKNLYGEQE